MMMMGHGGNAFSQGIQGNQSAVNSRMAQGGSPALTMQQRMAQGSPRAFHNQHAVRTHMATYQQFAGMNPAAFGQMVQRQNPMHVPGNNTNNLRLLQWTKQLVHRKL